MAYGSTTAIPSNRARKQKDVTFDDGDGTTKDAWIPAQGKQVSLNDVVLSVMNKHATGYIIVAVQVYGGGIWHTLVPLAVGPHLSGNFVHNFGGRIHSGSGSGTNEMIRVARMGTSTSWEATIVLTGEEV